MKMILSLIFHPFQFIGRSNLFTKITEFFNKKEWAMYLLTTLLTIVALFFIFIFPNL
ncbi:hypothetical protein BN85401060 [Alteracholeplasma palmae J233]|uniref:Uncharacterized protein n=1 Tax=Alteracholeplasma palmae (strain ATCC 49389 / J233) TaxID=1318466 RepID=U4KJS8_ALTPJ|nr:hypothetical protein [Alteracholeplasma palmae]CCV63683.1 hypothetical protein BN85401060 [Alteracholeplasma palmae J233]